jgi:hypothetical protein
VGAAAPKTITPNASGTTVFIALTPVCFATYSPLPLPTPNLLIKAPNLVGIFAMIKQLPDI